MKGENSKSVKSRMNSQGKSYPPAYGIANSEASNMPPLSRAKRLLLESKPPFFFSSGFDSKIKSWIMSNRHTNIFTDEWNLDCMAKSGVWAKILDQQGYEVERLDGYYDGHPHSWLTVGGQIFDPTASQFDVLGPIDQGKYQNARSIGW